MDTRKGNENKWLQVAKMACGIIAVLVGYLIGSSYAHANGVSNIVTYTVAFGIGLGAAACYYLIESKVLEVCFFKKYSLGRSALILVVGTLFAALTAYLSFSQVYYVASAGTRFADAKDNLIAAENAYIAATESTCRILTDKQQDPVNNLYTEAVRSMREAVKLASEATTREELDWSQHLFKVGGVKAIGCAGDEETGVKVLSQVILYPEQTPSDLSSQFWFNRQITGMKIYKGVAYQALVVVVVLNFLVVILAIFGCLFVSQAEPETHRRE